MYFWGYIRAILGIYWDNGKENGNDYSMRNIYIQLGVPTIMENQMEKNMENEMET